MTHRRDKGVLLLRDYIPNSLRICLFPHIVEPLPVLEIDVGIGLLQHFDTVGD